MPGKPAWYMNPANALMTAVSVPVITALGTFLIQRFYSTNENRDREQILERIKFRKSTHQEIQDVGIKSYVHENYYLEGNSTLENAQVLFLGERHSDWKLRTTNHLVAGWLSKSAKIIVLDELDPGEKNACYRWEMQSTFSAEQINSGKTVQYIQEAINNGFETSTLGFGGFVFPQLFPDIACSYWNLQGDVARRMFIERPAPEKMISELNLPLEVLEEIAQHAILQGGEVETLTVLAIARSRSMIRKILEAVEEYEQVIVIAGFNHVPHASRVKRYEGDRTDSEFSSQYLLNAISGLNYVSLLHKQHAN